MVLFKRKPVALEASLDVEDPDAQVWVIEATGEVFPDYDSYMARMDFYAKPKFICQVSGHSGLTFFEALKNEVSASREAEEQFPEPLKGPVLRLVQFKMISRIDNLVDFVFNEFQSDFFPGEAVTIAGDERSSHGVIRDKVTHTRERPDGLTEEVKTYLVTLDGQPGRDATFDGSQLSRDRKSFTKTVLRTFIKSSVTRETKVRAPWLVRHNFSLQYDIPTRIPAELGLQTSVKENKMTPSQKRILAAGDPNGGGPSPGQKNRLPDLKPAAAAAKSHKAKQHPHGQPGRLSSSSAHAHQAGPAAQTQLAKALPLHVAQAPAAVPPPRPKYPIEDLELDPRVGNARPPLNFYCSDGPASPAASPQYSDQIRMSSVGPLLETWNTLNVFCEKYYLDSFTFDDFVEAMCVSSEDDPVLLAQEIHCAVLKLIVYEQGDPCSVLPSLTQNESKVDEQGKGEAEAEAEAEEEDEDDEDDDEGPSLPARPVRATRSSLAKQEAERIAAEEAAAAAEAEAQVAHRADELLRDFDWVKELRKGNFLNGGWQRIIVGILARMSLKEHKRKACEDLLALLVPPEVENPTQELLLQNYWALDVNIRIQILQMMCMLTVETRTLRNFIDYCSGDMTQTRKQKADANKKLKQLIEEIGALHVQKATALNEREAAKAAAATGGEADSAGEVNGDDDDDTDNDVSSRPRLRRKQDRAASLQKKQAKLSKEEKMTQEIQRLDVEIQKKDKLIKQSEERIRELERDLRESDCPRTRVLGQDRFYNRYYWFERNGMPHGGIMHSATSFAEYANGCIWVQGPSQLERDGFLTPSTDFQADHEGRFGMSVPRRREHEEGATRLESDAQWGFYATGGELEKLLNWLDPRGEREVKLRKELTKLKDKISLRMEKRRSYLDGESAEVRDASDDGKRKGTRTRSQPSPEAPQYRCRRWDNSYFVFGMKNSPMKGHLHSLPPPPPAKGPKGKKRGAPADPMSPPPARKTRRH